MSNRSRRRVAFHTGRNFAGGMSAGNPLEASRATSTDVNYLSDARRDAALDQELEGAQGQVTEALAADFEAMDTRRDK